MYDVGMFFYCLEDEDVRIVNTKIEQCQGFCEFDWEFDSNYTLKELRELMMRISAENEGELHVMYESLNYKDLYTGERFDLPELE
jgi:hypothetical protein